MARRLINARAVLLGGLAAVAGAVAFTRRKTIARLLGRTSEPAPRPAPENAPAGTSAQQPVAPAPPPPVANADVAGPPANTATAVPAPEPQVHPATGGIDEAAEEAAAAAEAANIGGVDAAYAGPELGEPADEALRPLMEAGEGESEGQEQAEAELVDNAEPAAGDPLEGGRQIEAQIEAQSDPTAGELPFDDQSSHGNPRAEAEQSAVGTHEPLEDPPAGSDPDAPGAGADMAEGATPTPPTPGATTADASSLTAPWTPEPETGDTLAAGTAGEGTPTTGGSLSGLAPTSEDGEAAGAEAPATEEQPRSVWATDPSPEADLSSDPAPPTVEQPKPGKK